MDDIRTTWVFPFYLNILHANYAMDNSERMFVSRAKDALKTIPPAVIDELFKEIDWRCRITAAWFCGMKQWKEYTEIIGTSLLESRVCYAGQGYCFALASFGDERSSKYLIQYLETYLKQNDKYYDQGWAMPALMWIDEKQGTDYSSRFLGENGLWNQFVADKLTSSDYWSIERRKECFYKIMNYTLETFK